jgi:hypothetical protein
MSRLWLETNLKKTLNLKITISANEPFEEEASRLPERLFCFEVAQQKALSC